MRKLTVKNFSVIKEAELEFGKITVLIGPQSSGKSLLCKLAYFFQKVVIEIAEESIRKESSLEGFGQKVYSEFTFNNWFPVFGSESGAKVTYADGQFSISLSRSSSSPGPDRPGMIKGAPATFSVEISNAYSMTLLGLQRDRNSSGSANYPRYTKEIRDRLEALQSPESAIYSYIPSTRSFFTSPQKAVIGTSQRLDPITVRFSQDLSFDFATRIPRVGLDSDLTSWIDQSAREVLQGEVRVIGNSEVFKTKDGREIPLSFLSSGTQELLPLVTCLREFVGLSEAVATTLDLQQALHRRLFFVEEPEASVFPSTQYDLVRIFARMANEPSLDASWVITTHSPYLLSAFNDLIKAGQAAKARPEKTAKIEKIVPRQYWIKEGDFTAYAFDGKDGVLRPIMDEETGLINGDILDSISDKIGAEFDGLLSIEYAN